MALPVLGKNRQYLSHDFGMDILDYLQRHWPLDYRKPWKSGADGVTEGVG